MSRKYDIRLNLEQEIPNFKDAKVDTINHVELENESLKIIGASQTNY